MRQYEIAAFAQAWEMLCSCPGSPFDAKFCCMETSGFPLDQYLERIGLGRPPHPDEDGLKDLHSAQAFSIPFENFDIHLGRTISLEPGDLVAKMIHRRRGGYCFELNGLLGLALKALGFKMRPLTARVHYGRTDPGARTHEVLIVTISGREWLADCGFGGPGLRLPMPAVPDRVEEHFGARYRLRRDPRYGAVLQKESAGDFVDLYSFNVHEMTLDIDLEMANHFTSTWPSSIFRLSRMCALPKPWGRVTLSDMELAIHNAEGVVRRILPPGPAYLEAVTEHFGLRLDARYEDLAPLKAISRDREPEL